MLYHRNELKSEIREKPRGGAGTATYLHYTEDQGKTHKNIEIIAEVNLPPGSSIGTHAHTDNMEFYIILKGKGIASDNGTEKPISEGDVLITGNGHTHGIRNTGDIPLVFHAIVVKN